MWILNTASKSVTKYAVYRWMDWPGKMGREINTALNQNFRLLVLMKCFRFGWLSRNTVICSKYWLSQGLAFWFFRAIESLLLALFNLGWLCHVGTWVDVVPHHRHKDNGEECIHIHAIYRGMWAVHVYIYIYLKLLLRGPLKLPLGCSKYRLTPPVHCSTVEALDIYIRRLVPTMETMYGVFLYLMPILKAWPLRHNRLVWLAWLQRGYATMKDVAKWHFEGFLPI